MEERQEAERAREKVREGGTERGEDEEEMLCIAEVRKLPTAPLSGADGTLSPSSAACAIRLLYPSAPAT